MTRNDPLFGTGRKPLRHTGFMVLSRFSQYPITIYGPSLHMLLSTAVPFAFIAFYPSTVLLGRDAYWTLGLSTPLVGLVVFSLGAFIWRQGLRRYEPPEAKLPRLHSLRQQLLTDPRRSGFEVHHQAGVWKSHRDISIKKS